MNLPEPIGLPGCVATKATHNPYSLLTDELVEQALHQDLGENTILKSYEVKDFTKKGDNFFSLVTSVVVDYQLNDVNHQQTYVAKLNHGTNVDETLTNMLRMAYQREPIVLKTLVPIMNKSLDQIDQPHIRAPKYLASCVEDGQEVLLENDLRREGFVMFDKFKEMDFNHAKFVVEELGRFHACSILLESQIKGSSIKEFYPPVPDPCSYDPDHFSLADFSKMTQAQVQLTLDTLNSVQKADHITRWAANLFPFCCELWWRNSDPSDKFRVLIHGDCWNNNILFKYNEEGVPTDMRFVDFQLSRVSSPACDLNYFFYSSIGGELRQKYKKQLMVQYYLAFTEVLILSQNTVPFTFEELEQEFVSRMPFGCISAMMLLGTVLVKPDEAMELQDVFDTISESGKNKRMRFIEQAKSNPSLKSRFLSVFDEMTEFGVFERKRTIFNPYPILTEELVEDALQNDVGKQARMVAFDVRNFTKKGDNYSSNVVGIKVHYIDQGTNKHKTYVVKLNPKRECGDLAPIFEVFYKKESVVLKYIIKEMNIQLEKIELPPIKVPTLFSYCNDDGKQVKILNNLRTERFVMFDREKGMDVKHAILVLEELGRFHASSFLYANTLKHSILEEFPNEFGRLESLLKEDNPGFQMFEQILKSQLDLSSKLIANANGYEKVIPWLERTKDGTARIFLPSYDPNNKKFNVLSHGDCWNNNILFKYNDDGEPVDVRLVDLECPRLISLACDLNYFFFTSLEGNVRQKNKHLFLTHYYLSFCKVLHLAEREVPFSFEELKQEVKNQMHFGCVAGMMVLPAVLMDAENTVEIEDLSKGNIDDTLLGVQKKCLDNVKRSKTFVNRYLSMFDEMLEHKIIT